MELHQDSALVMITGSARSGTTLFAQCLDHHPQVQCSSDPMNELFRGFMHFAYYKVCGERKFAAYPIDHFFLSGNAKVREFLDSTHFAHQIPDFLRSDLLDRISKRGGKYCPVLKDALPKCRARRFDELILEILSLLYKDSAREDCLWVGFKDAWCEQLILPLSRTFPNMKFINILRDPRAVISSNFFSRSKYPLFSSIRDWRKSVYYTWKFQYSDPNFRERFLNIRYEDLVEEPRKVLKRVTEILSLTFYEEMLTSVFQKQNSSYPEASNGGAISVRSKEKWKTGLPEGLRRQVELYCFPEMCKLGYGEWMPPIEGEWLHAFFGYEIPYEELGNWCRELIPGKFLYRTFWRYKNAGIELLRLQFYEKRSRSKTILRTFFYEEAYYEWLKEANKARTRELTHV